MGAVGAILIAANMGLALPLVIMGRRWAQVGVLSLLGLPPFGGFVGTLLVAASGANAGGLLWLAVLLVGTALVGAGWLGISGSNRKSSISTADIPRTTRARWRAWLTDPILILSTLLAISQLVLFAASFWLASALGEWANIPWLTGP
jgi:formate hydrogenlyase subunit 3/multisubunit Na+/H+ antiporter MnhD subunit